MPTISLLFPPDVQFNDSVLRKHGNFDNTDWVTNVAIHIKISINTQDAFQISTSLPFINVPHVCATLRRLQQTLQRVVSINTFLQSNIYIQNNNSTWISVLYEEVFFKLMINTAGLLQALMDSDGILS